MIFNSVTSYALQKSDAEYWAGTNILPVYNAKFASYFGKNQNGCFTNNNFFKACVEALNVLASEAKINILPKKLEGDSDFKVGPLQREVLGGIGLYQALENDVNEVKLSPKAAWEKTERIRQKTDVIYAELMQAQQKVDFFQLSTAVLELLKATHKKDKIPAAFAASYNVFMNIAEDAHAHIDSAEKLDEQNVTVDSSFTGIGMVFNFDGKEMTALEIVSGGPAESAGIKAGDTILSVDDVPVVDIGDSQAIRNKIVGPEGQTVKIIFLSSGVQTTKVIVRKKVIIEGVKSKLLNSFGQKIGYIQFAQFAGADLCTKIKDKILSFEKNEGVKGLILDLRNNGGGRLDLSICITGLFVGKEVIVKVKDLKKEQFQAYKSSQDKITNLPLVVLINRGSASASEIVSGAIRDYERGLIVGEGSFGKGSVQSPFVITGSGPVDVGGFNLMNPNDDLSQGTILLYQTIQRFYQPSGTTNQSVGIGADIEAPQKPGASQEELFAVREQQLYPNALVAEGEKWKPSPLRVEKTAKIKECLGQSQQTAQKYVANKLNELQGNYQMLTAEEVLFCQTQLGL